jgi:predicted Zn-ribbon and HTH transcriptional regulator
MFPYRHTYMIQDLRICRKCGVLFDIEVRKNKDCPVCHSGEHMPIRSLT